LTYATIFISSHFLLLSYAPEDLSQINNLNSEIVELTDSFQDEKCELLNEQNILTKENKQIYEDFVQMREAYDRLQRSKRRSYAYHASFLGKFELSRTNLNLAIDVKMLDALKAYKGPKFTITSARRLHSYGSQHYKGEAVDIR